jgi:5-methylthioadenosine/S-adenosylhomocysteine deaminase
MHVADARGPEKMIHDGYGCSTIGRMEDLRLVRPDLVAIHAVYVEAKEIDLLPERKVKVSHNPTANMFLGDGAARIAYMKSAGMCVGLGTDRRIKRTILS